MELPFGCFQTVFGGPPVRDKLIMLWDRAVYSLDCKIQRIRNVNGVSGYVVKTGVVWIWRRRRRAINLDVPNQISDGPDSFVL